MREQPGRSLPLSLPRRWIGDLLHFARRVPVVAAERQFRIKKLARARRSLAKPPSWNSLLIKAIGIMSARHVAFRRAYMPYPWPHLYECPYSVASVVFDREFDGEAATFLCPMIAPETMTLTQIHDRVQAWKHDPVSAHGCLRRLVRNARPPLPIRRILWAAGLYGSGQFRARNFGTFAVNSIAGMRGKMLMFQTPITSVWYYGAPTDHEMLIQVAFDHRVMDGVQCNRGWSELESILNDELVAHLAVDRNPESLRLEAAYA